MFFVLLSPLPLCVSLVLRSPLSLCMQVLTIPVSAPPARSPRMPLCLPVSPAVCLSDVCLLPLWRAPSVKVLPWDLPGLPKDLSVGRSDFREDHEQWMADAEAVWCASCGYWIVKNGYSHAEWIKGVDIPGGV